MTKFSKIESSPGLKNLEKILTSLIYFDIFSYPLSLDDIANYSVTPIDKKTIKEYLDHLTYKKIVFNHNGFYSLTEGSNITNQRLENSERAKKYTRIARTVSSMIWVFPFVRGVFISGSLSKGSMPKNSDIDYFLITKPGRLWICRTILILFKKIFLLNSRKYFCLNYFIDEDHLEIEEKNQFTATEIYTLLPMHGKSIFHQFIEKNDWVKEYYFNWQNGINRDLLKAERLSYLKKILEFPMQGAIGDIFDRWLMNITVSHWQKKFDHFDKNKFDLTLKSRPYISKHHPLDFQTKVLAEFQKRKNEILSKLNSTKLDFIGK